MNYISEILTTGLNSTFGVQKPSNELEQALAQSILDQQQGFTSLNPEQRKRVDGIPEIVQLYDPPYIRNQLVILTVFYKHIFQIIISLNSYYRIRSKNCHHYPKIPQTKKNKLIKENKYHFCARNLFKTSQRMVQSLQRILSYMIASNRKFIDPSDVIKNTTDDYGSVLTIGEEKDVGEFNCHFLSRISDGLESPQTQQKQQSNILAMYESQIFPSISQSKLNFSDDKVFAICDMQLPQRRQPINVSNKTLQQFYFGKTKNFIVYPSSQQKKQIEIEEQFGFITLNPIYSDFYESWDKSFFTTIDGFRNDEDKIVSAKKYCFLKEVPETIFFQLSRVGYDQEECKKKLSDFILEKTVKINNQFNFPKEMYIDRFLLENQKKYLQIREEIQKKRFDIEYKRAEIQSLINFDSTNQSILQSFENTINYFKNPNVLQRRSQKEIDRQCSEIQEQVKLTSEQKVIVESLNKEYIKIQQTINRLRQEITQLEQQIQKSFNDMQKNPYILKSVLVHEGIDSESGHYYAFIQGTLDKWHRYDDTNVKRVEFETVMEKSQGGPLQNSSAYFLVYQRKQSFTPSTKLPVMLYSLEGKANDYYNTMIPIKNLHQVREDNQKFALEIEEFNNEQLVQKILEIYDFKFQVVNETARIIEAKIKNIKIKPLPIINACVFLKLSDIQPTIKENLYKYYILESCIFDLKKKSIKECIIQDKKMIEKLNFRIFELYKYPEKIYIPESDLKFLERQINDFEKNVWGASYYIYIFQQLEALQLENVLKSLDAFISLTEDQNSNTFIYQARRLFLTLIPCIVLKEVEDNPQVNQEKVLRYLQLIVGIIQKHFGDPELHIMKLQFQIWFRDIQNKRPLLNDKINQLISLFDSDVKTNELERIQTILQEPIKELTEFIQKMSQKYDRIQWDLTLRCDEYIDCALKYTDWVQKFYKKEINFLERVYKQELMEEKDRKQLLR